MGLLGALATVGHFLFTAAYREADASLLAPVNYLHLVWAALLGAVVFGHVPDLITMGGMAMVAGAGVAVALRAKGAKA
jgi:drug/metabolite transporter (DMT)-like permease